MIRTTRLPLAALFFAGMATIPAIAAGALLPPAQRPEEIAMPLIE
jgi:hypothetical protein